MTRKLSSTTKKRKFQQHSTEDEQPQKLALVEKDEAYNKMSLINDGMLDMIRKADTLDFQYYLDNFEMVNEFVGNVEYFVMKFNASRRWKIWDRLNSDIWGEIFSYIPTSEMVHSVQLVSKTFRSNLKVVGNLEVSLIGLKRCLINETRVNCMLSYIHSRNITRLELRHFSGHALAALASSRRMRNLKSLDLSVSEINEYAANHFSQSKYMKNITKLDLDHCEGYFSTLLSGRATRNLKHLKMNFIRHYARCKGTEKFTSSCRKLESLELDYCRTFDSYLNIKSFIQQNASTLVRLSYLNIPGDNVFSVQFSKLCSLSLSNIVLDSFVIESILFSGNCPILTTLSVRDSKSNTASRKGTVDSNRSLTNLSISSCDNFGWFLPNCLSLHKLSLDCTQNELFGNFRAALTVQELNLNIRHWYHEPLEFYETLFNSSSFNSVSLLKCNFPSLKYCNDDVCKSFTNLQKIVVTRMLGYEDRETLKELFPKIDIKF
ncbi:Hypothetical protein NAEGRDRAFT_67601 [Naegleria gruberi]|uniref:F-box domain-containing protein n=1 Tax=Naegleria gruberi TaxID=5762 RepID=D2VFE8_NAEGR|nr:uncharacterized protein NAEGRDRAFT_67601 [Naegleria gruberi]EFC44450.1 Hypothetical protein NAEGRDRAFT_67601 [Naegleria gruberi]|eukprot:XP_002677194.1 Hypothetical protein NAEGRDRAFT_67601 [Naegleria gruberi strain NEG-M]